LAPDVVHAISLLDPFEPDPASDVVVFQASSRPSRPDRATAPWHAFLATSSTWEACGSGS
jgi:hypothetical protein